MEAILTQTTCGLNCWLAEEDKCRCYCFGSNHGLLLKEGAKQPQRMAKIGGSMYLLFEVGTFKELINIAENFNKLYGSYEREYNGHKITYHKRETDINAPCRLKPASESQINKWAELSGKKFERWDRAYLLWIKMDLKEKYKPSLVANN